VWSPPKSHERIGFEAGTSVSKVPAFDSKGIPVPAPARIAVPLPHAARQIAPPLQWNDTGVMDHLVENDDVVLGLKQLHFIVIRTRHHRETGIKADQATFRKSLVFRTVRADSC